MARIKTVYPSVMVAHLWANRHPHAIRNASGNISAASGRIYSYGSHFVLGAFLDQPAKGGECWILRNGASRSNTTSKHQSYVWRALSAEQEKRVIHLPFSISDSDLSRVDIDSGLNSIAAQLLETACERFEKAQKAQKHFAHYYSSAWDAIRDASRVYAYTGNRAALRKLPTREKPQYQDNLKSWVKTESARVARLINGEKYLQRAQATATRAAQSFEHASGYAETYRATRGKPDAHYITATEVVRRVKDCANVATHGANQYAQAGKKASPALVRILAQCKALEKEFDPFAHAEHMADCRARLEKIVANARIHLAWAQRYKHESFKLASGFLRTANRENLARDIGRELSNEYCTVNHVNAVYSVTGEHKKAAEMWGILEQLRDKYNRVRTGDNLADAIEETRDYVAKVKNKPAHQYTQPNMADVEREMVNYRYVRNGAAIPTWYEKQVSELRALVEAEQAAYAERIEREHGERIAAWRAGERVTLPYGVGTLARIRGDNVETSRGAVVPLAHACRLIRIARIVAARGGQEWASGEGPMVGHFRVTRIGPDMSATIGCHVFDSKESHHMAHLLESACVGVDCETTNG